MRRLVRFLVPLGLAVLPLSPLAVAGAQVVPEPVKAAICEDEDRLVGEVYRLSTEEASRKLDEVFSKSDNFASEATRRRLQRLLVDGLGVMYSYDMQGVVWGKYKDRIEHHLRLVHLIPEVEGLSDCVYSPSICEDVARWVEGAPDTFSAYSCSVRTQYRPLLEDVRAFETAPSRAASVGSEVVADVETVRLLSLTHFDASAFPDIGDEDRYNVIDRDDEGNEIIHSPPKPRANYLVTLRVRPEFRGTNDFVRFSFPATLDETPLTTDGKWLFYRGITLSVGFATSNGVARVARIDPVLPYPPYAREKVALCCPDEEAPQKDAFDRVIEPLEGVRSLFVKYGDHTYVQYCGKKSLLSGPLGAFPDFSATTLVRVWTDGAAARPDYWRDAWFGFASEDSDGDDPGWGDLRVKVTPAVEEAAPSDALAFSLRGIRLPEVSLRPPATMKDLAEFLTLATQTCDTGRWHYVVTADASCARRPLRPYAAKNVDPHAVLEEVCRQNGCDFSVGDTNVTIYASVGETDCTPPKLAELVPELTEKGFASVAGADYVGGSFYSSLKGKGVYVEEDAVIPRIFGSTCWVKPVAGKPQRVQFVAYGSLWWEVAAGKHEGEPWLWRSATPVRLRRDIRKLVFALEEGEPKNALNALTFALQIHTAGYIAEASQIVALLWRNDPKEAHDALQEVRARLDRVRTECPTAAEWVKLTQKKLGLKEENDDEG